MIRRYIGKRLRRAARRLIADEQRARMLAGCPVGEHAARVRHQSWRRYENWRLVWIVLYERRGNHGRHRR